MVLGQHSLALPTGSGKRWQHPTMLWIVLIHNRYSKLMVGLMLQLLGLYPNSQWQQLG